MSQFTKSPGVVSYEIDATVRQKVEEAGSVGVTIGKFNWGPVLSPTLVESEESLVDTFSVPTANNYIEYFNGINFLSYSPSLMVIRCEANSMKNSTMSGTGILINNDQDYMNNLHQDVGGLYNGTGGGTPIVSDSSTFGPWISKYPGSLGNSIEVEMCFAKEPAEVFANTASPINEMKFTSIADTNSSNTSYTLDSFYSIVPRTFKYEVQFGSNTGGIFSGENLSDHFPEIDSSFECDYAGSTLAQGNVINFSFNGDNYDFLIESFSDPINGKYEGYLIVNEDPYTIPTSSVDTTNDIITINKKERSTFREYSYDSIGSNISNKGNLLGKVSCGFNERTVYGVGTVFTKQVSVGDKVNIAGEIGIVETIVNDSEMQLKEKRYSATCKDASWTRQWKYAQLFSNAPATSNYAIYTNGGTAASYNDQLHMVVVDNDGKISGTPGTLLESYSNLSLAIDGKDDYGNPLYYKNFINANSKFVRWSGHVNYVTNWGDKQKGTTFTTYNRPSSYSRANGVMTNGADGSVIQSEKLINAMNILKDKETYPVDFIMSGWNGSISDINWHVVITHAIKNIAEVRKDCVVCVSANYDQVFRRQITSDDIVEQYIKWREPLPSSSYAIMDGNYKYQYDKYNDTFRWVPFSGDMAGLMARNDDLEAEWVSPAGYRKGTINNVIKLGISPSQQNRDDLYLNEINPVINVKGQGTVLFGDKTMYKIASSFDRINVRRLFIALRRNIEHYAKQQLFEFNNAQTRLRFYELIEPYLDNVRSEQGVYDYKIICDETNNTPDLIDENKFLADIYVKPQRSINFIKLNFVAVKTGADFSEFIS